MNIDFVNTELGTTAYTNVVASDDCDVKNLLQKTNKGRSSISDVEMTFLGLKDCTHSMESAGFMADYFVRPPVDIVIQFPCPIDIDRIVVSRINGAKRIAEFVLSTANAKPTCITAVDKRNASISSSATKLAPGRHSDGLSSKQGEFLTPKPTVSTSATIGNAFLYQFPCQYDPDFSLTEIRKQNRTSFHTVGRFSSSTTDAEVICFCKNRARCNALNDGEHEKERAHSVSLFGVRYLYGVSHLILRILRTECSTVAAIKRLEAWGRPSFQNKPTVNKKIYSLMRQYKEKCLLELQHTKCSHNSVNMQAEPLKEQKCNESSINLENGNQNSCSNKLIIPEDFMDPITYDMMVLPVLLPSGHTIDSATLEKCIKEDERHGRIPLDPFSGIPLRSGSEAVPNTALKLRIDRFLLQNKMYRNPGSHWRQTSGVNSLNANVVERVVKNSRKRGNKDGDDKDFKSAKISSGIRNNRPKPGSEIIVSHAGSTLKYEESKKGIDTLVSTKLMHLSSQNARNLECSNEASHEESLQNSLEAALKQVAWNAFKTKANRAGRPSFACSICKRHGKELNLFQLPCQHLNCRECMQKDPNANICTICTKYFSNGEVMRVHFSEYFDS